MCCSLTAFQTQWPLVCETCPHTGGVSREMLQSAPLADILRRRSIHTHADVSTAGTTSLGALSCTTALFAGIPVLDCTGTLGPGDTATASLTVIPTATGAFGTLT